MQENKPSILCTGPVDYPTGNVLKNYNVILDVIPFYSITHYLDETASSQLLSLLNQKATVVFTSGNAIQPIAGLLDKSNPEWKIYCTAGTTYKMALGYFKKVQILNTASNAKSLAEKILQNPERQREIFYLCGNLRRKELPDTLRRNNIKVTEITVYQTNLTPTTINKSYDAILFFSPGAAKSFFSENKIPPKTVLFALGTTTLTELSSLSSNKIILGKELNKFKLIDQAISYCKNTLYKK